MMMNGTRELSLLLTVSLQMEVGDILYFTLFILGVFGNIFSLFIFSSIRRTTQISSDYIYSAISSSITNLFCLIRYTVILYSVTRQPLSELVRKKWWACKFYELSFSFYVISVWITIFWMFERLMCLSVILRSFFNRWFSFKFNFIIPITFLVIILGCVIGPPVAIFEPQISK